MTDKEIVERAKEAEKRTGFGELVHSPISKGVNSAFGIGFIEGMVEYRNSLQEEPVSRTPADVESAMQEVKEKSRAFTEAHQGEDTDNILAQMRGEEPVSEELEEAAFDYAESCKYDGGKKLLCVEHFKAGAKWQKKQLMKDAISAELYSDGMLTPLIGVKDKEKLKGIKFGDKVKLIIIKDEQL